MHQYNEIDHWFIFQLGTAFDSEYLSELTEEELDSTSFNVGSKRLRGFLYWDYKFFRPFFTRRLINFGINFQILEQDDQLFEIVISDLPNGSSKKGRKILQS